MTACEHTRSKGKTYLVAEGSHQSEEESSHKLLRTVRHQHLPSISTTWKGAIGRAELLAHPGRFKMLIPSYNKLFLLERLEKGVRVSTLAHRTALSILSCCRHVSTQSQPNFRFYPVFMQGPDPWSTRTHPSQTDSETGGLEPNQVRNEKSPGLVATRAVRVQLTLAPEKAANPDAPLTLAVAPVKMIVPALRFTMRRAASRPVKKPAKQAISQT
jgi:hypothetical protein